MILLSNLLSEDRTGLLFGLCNCCMQNFGLDFDALNVLKLPVRFMYVSMSILLSWLMITQCIFATLEVPMTTSITKIAEAMYVLDFRHFFVVLSFNKLAWFACHLTRQQCMSVAGFCSGAGRRHLCYQRLLSGSIMLDALASRISSAIQST